MAESISTRLAALLREAGAAHHQAFAAVNGHDPDWPLWYAQYLAAPIETLLGHRIDVTVLAVELRRLDSTHREQAAAMPWQDFYAAGLLSRLQ